MAMWSLYFSFAIDRKALKIEKGPKIQVKLVSLLSYFKASIPTWKRVTLLQLFKGDFQRIPQKPPFSKTRVAIKLEISPIIRRPVPPTNQTRITCEKIAGKKRSLYPYKARNKLAAISINTCQDHYRMLILLKSQGGFSKGNQPAL